MQAKRIASIAALALLCLMACALAFSSEGDKVKTKGMIVSRTGETLIVKSSGGKTTVILTEDTKTKDNKGMLGLRKEFMANTVLIPGLKVDVDGISDDQGRVIAKTITVDGDDLETAEMIQAGLHPTAEQVAANMQAIETNRQGIAANKVELAANREYIENNKKNIAANKQQIEQNTKDIQENTDRFMALSEYDVKGEATVKFKRSEEHTSELQSH